jgi:miniconductance mechanosensitive channel
MTEYETDFAAFIEEWLINTAGIDPAYSQLFKMIILLIAMTLTALVFWWMAQALINKFLERLISATSTEWDDVLHEKGAFRKLAHIVPALVIGVSAPVVFTDYPAWIPLIEKITAVYIALVVIRLIVAVIDSTTIMLSRSEKYRDKPIASFTQLAKILVWSIGLVILASIVLGRNPIYMFSALGAVSAVLILVFKDTLLGFTASIQITMNDMVRIGDWVSVPKYGADGDVMEINLTTVKVRNWDKTISTVPTYSFIADSFKNWRGMEESGGRRIKRSINVKISTVKFCSPELLEGLHKVRLLKDHFSLKEKDLQEYNARVEIGAQESPVNGRRLTNIGVFRAYILAYLKAHPDVKQDMTLLVRQLDPTENGIPIEIYCFSKKQAWADYEGIQADIFDHIMAAIRYFDLEIFESPAGSDLERIKAN